MTPTCESIEQTIASEAMPGPRPNKNQDTTDRLRAHALILLMCLCFAASAIGLVPVVADAQPADTARDGQHDFDFNTGVWHTHIRRVPDPFSASSEVIELNGTVPIRTVWGGARSWKRLRPTVRRDIGRTFGVFVQSAAASVEQ